MKIRFSRYGKRWNKYNAHRSRCKLGHSHKSGLESQYCHQLQILIRAGEIKEFQYERKFELKANGSHICNFFPDFFVIYTNGREEIHETKGLRTDLFNIKWKLMKALFPQYNYVLVK